MKILKKTSQLLSMSAAAALCLGVATTAQAGANSAEVSVNVTFSRALVVTAGDPVQFGNILINGNAGTVNLDKDTGALTYSGGVMNADSATASRGYITFIGPRPGNVGITYENSVVLTNATTNTTVTFSPATEVSSYNISAHNENVQIKIGGSLNFDVNTAEGLYSGSVTIGVDYT
jgi:hypothetical protein